LSWQASLPERFWFIPARGQDFSRQFAVARARDDDRADQHAYFAKSRFPARGSRAFQAPRNGINQAAGAIAKRRFQMF
jgi:hypothetical protein